MRLRGSLFWGIVLILLAIFLLGLQMGWLKGDLFGYFWPAVAILFGIWLLISAVGRSRVETQTISIPRENATRARIKFDHGAGRLNIHSGAADPELLNGVFGAEMDYHSSLVGDSLEVKLRNAPQFWTWYPGRSLDWNVSLTRDIPLNLKIDSGASSTFLDLTDLKVTDLNIDTGASTTEVRLPASAGNTLVDIDTGASTVKLSVPVGVGARIRLKTGLASTNIDTNRFLRMDDGLYQSNDYASAANRADITIDSGVGTIEIK